jgi:hypothetical protein
MFFNGRSSKFSEGAWGIIRVLDKPVGDLQPLPNKAYGKEGMPERLPVCPQEAPVKAFKVVAMDHPGMSFNTNAPEAIEVDFERCAAHAVNLTGQRGGLSHRDLDEQTERRPGLLLGVWVGV